MEALSADREDATFSMNTRYVRGAWQSMGNLPSACLQQTRWSLSRNQRTRQSAQAICQLTRTTPSTRRESFRLKDISSEQEPTCEVVKLHLEACEILAEDPDFPFSRTHPWIGAIISGQRVGGHFDRTERKLGVFTAIQGIRTRARHHRQSPLTVHEVGRVPLTRTGSLAQCPTAGIG